MTPPLVRLADLAAHVSQRVRLRGRVSTTPWQHMIAFVPGHQTEYVDADGAQLVAYVEAPLARDALLELTGVVLRVAGPGKRSSETDPEHVEYGLRVEAATRVR